MIHTRNCNIAAWNQYSAANSEKVIAILASTAIVVMIMQERSLNSFYPQNVNINIYHKGKAPVFHTDA